MRVEEHIEHLAGEGALLVEAAGRAGPDHNVPGCPGWQVRDLLAHVGGVHRWATSFVRDARTDPRQPAEEAFFTAPPDADLLDWVHAGHAALVEALRTADPAVACWSFLPAPTPLAFWARRQAHETTIHRVDAQRAAGIPATVPAPVAADGLAELLEGFHGRPRGRLVADPPVSIGVRSTDTDHAWTVHVLPDGRRITPTAEPADLVLTGLASALYLTLWNRADLAGLRVEGDRRVWEVWRERARVTWS